MKTFLSWIATTLYLALATWTFAADDCTALERDAENRAKSIAFAAEELGAFRDLGDAALIGLKKCPNSARLWYYAARSAEILQAPFEGKAFAEFGGERKIVHDAAEYAPQSAPVATVLARVEGSLSTAERAYQLDPNYRPARRALALALAKQHSFQKALKLLDVPDPAADDRIARSRILLATGRPRDAATEAKKALAQRQAAKDEPTPTSDIVRDSNEVLGLALIAQGNKKDAMPALRTAAAAGSAVAKSELAKLQ